MKLSFKFAAFAALTCALSLKAETLKLSTTSLSYGQGGAFAATPAAGASINNEDYASQARSGTSGFLTFCLEYSEEFYSGYSYNFAVNNGAVAGGVGGQTLPNYDGISIGTAYLYSLFAQGALDEATNGAFNYSQSACGYLQNAIWHLEGEGKASNWLVDFAKQNNANWSADANGAFGVKALNLTFTQNIGTHAAGSRAQDQLYYTVPDQGASVVLLGLSLIGFVALRRKFRK